MNYKVIIKTSKPIEDMATTLYTVSSSMEEHVYCCRTLQSWDGAMITLGEVARQAQLQRFSIRKVELIRSINPENEILP